MPSTDRDAYLRFAGNCIRKAGSETEPAKKSLLIVMAVAWARLAKRAGTQKHNRAPAR
jgi:hypothetical protein